MQAALLAVLFTTGLSSATGLLRREFGISEVVPPEERWNEVIDEYKDVLPAMLVGMEMQLWPTKPHPQEGLEDQNVSTQPDSVPEEWWLRHHNISPEHLLELIGIVRRAANEEVTLRRLIIFQMMTEIWRGSSDVIGAHTVGVLAGDPNGTVLHGWNMDFNFNFIALGKRMTMADVALDLHFKGVSGKPVWCVGFPGRVGVLSGQQQGGVSLLALPSPSTLTASDVAKQPDTDLAGQIPVEILVRDTLMKHMSFKDTVAHLERSQLHSPAAFMVGGPDTWDGAVVDKVKLGEDAATTALNPHAGKWFIVSGCSPSLERECKEAVEGIEQEVSGTNLLTALRSRPLFGMNTLVTEVKHPRKKGFHALVLAKDRMLALPEAARRLKSFSFS